MLNFLGRATLQNWSLILYGTKQFNPTENADMLKQNKIKLYPNKKKNNKNKQRNEKNSTKSPSSVNTKLQKTSNKSKNKNILSTPKYFTPINLYSTHNNKKKNPKPTEGISFFYAVNNSKFRNAGESVKEYLKFVKNITITYPVMIPALDLDSVKSRDSFISRKIQKQKEKSRDINSNAKLFTTRPSTTAVVDIFTAKPWNKTTAEVRAWDLVLYGTATPPALDTINVNTNSNLNEVTPEDIQSNSIDNDGTPRTWAGDAEIKKDTSGIEEGAPRINAISGCEKTNGHICIECPKDQYEFNGKCMDKCPEKYYASNLETKPKETAEELDTTRNICLACHYTCRLCSGSLDYQCLSCFPDAVLTNVSSKEVYCYPISVMEKIQDEKWFFRAFLLLCFVILASVIVGVVYLCKDRQKRSERKYKSYKPNYLKNIRDIERTVKNTVYSDSE